MKINTQNTSRLEAILEAVDAAIITIDSAGIIVDCNAATLRMFGYQRNQLLDQNVTILMPAPFKAEHDQYLRNHLETGVNRIIGSGRKVKGQHESGREFPVHLSVARYQENDDIYFTGILHDLTELETANSINDRLGVIVEEAANEVYTFNPDSLHFTSANRSAYENLGYTDDQFIELTPIDIVRNLNRKTLQQTLAPLLDGTQQRVELSTELVRSDGTVYQADVALHLTSSVDPPEMVAIVQDVTEKNRLLQSLHRNQRIESIGNLTGGIAHDFNNILTVIMGNLDLLEDETDPVESRELLSEATEAAKMGSRLTNRLLAFARRSPLSPQEVDINSLVESLTEMLSRTLGGNVSLQVKLANDLWITQIDISALENALVNLAINARDAMPDGGRLLIETKNCFLDDDAIPGEDLNPGDYIKISVTDTGIGIPQDIKDSIFEPFVSSKKGNSSGLGLSMVYGFIKQSGGYITVYSEPDQGTCFCLYLRRVDKQTEVVPEQENVQERHIGNKTILLAEDDDKVRKVVAKKLKRLGYLVVEAVDGFDALEKYKATSGIDLIFSDISMTEGMTGYDLALAIRSIDPDQAILLTSGFAEDVVNTEKLKQSGLPLLRKPYDIATLEQHIVTTLAQEH